MAHPMYGIDAYLSRFPLVDKALSRTESEMEAAFFSLGGEEAIVNAPKRIIEAVDQTIDGADAEKEALIISALYLLAPQAAAEDKPKLNSEYGAVAGAAIGAVLADAQTSFSAKKQAVPEKIAQAGTIIGIVAMQSLHATLSEAGASVTMPPEAAEMMKAQMTAGEKELMPSLNAPRLEALYHKAKQALFAVIEAGAAPDKKNGKKPGGPKI